MKPDTIPAKDRPLVEQFRIISKKHAETDGAARLMEEMKTPSLEQRVGDYIEANPEVAHNKALTAVKGSPEWKEYITEMVNLRTQASLLKAQRDYIKMQADLENSANYRHGQEMKMAR